MALDLTRPERRQAFALTDMNENGAEIEQGQTPGRAEYESPQAVEPAALQTQ